MRLDLRKLRFRQPKLVATHLCLLFGSRESRHYARANTFMGPDPRAGTPIKSRPVEREGSVEVIGSPKAPPRAADPTHLLRLSRLSSCSWSLSESLTGDGVAIFTTPAVWALIGPTRRTPGQKKTPPLIRKRRGSQKASSQPP